MNKKLLCATILGLALLVTFNAKSAIIDISVEASGSTLLVIPHTSSSTEGYEVRVIYTEQGSRLRNETLWQPIGTVKISAKEGRLYDVTLEVRNSSSSKVQYFYEESVSLANLFQNKIQKNTHTPQSKTTSAAFQTSFFVDAEAFPRISIAADLIYDDLAFDGSSDNLPLLTENEISIAEDGRFEQSTRLVQPDPNSSTKIVDIVFVHDDSGSLGDEAAQVNANIINFVQGLSDENFDFRISLLPYGGSGRFSDPSGTLLDNGSLTDDPAVFQANIDQMRFDGGTERAFDAVKLAIDGTLWRPSTQKVVILVTDENNDTGSIDEATVTQSLIDNNILFYGLTNGHSEFTRMAAAVSGRIFNIRSDFSTILPEIGADLSSRYNVQYITDNSNFDGVERKVDFSVNTLDNLGSPISGIFEVRYTPFLPIEIGLSSNTALLTQSGQLPGKTLPIRALIDSQVALTSVRLGYRNSSETEYILVNMFVQTDGSWLADIPETSVIAGTVNFYILVNSAAASKTLPGADPQTSPLLITVFPNVPPVLTHTPVISSVADQDLVISATAEDATNEVSTVKLFYRIAGAPLYTEVSTDFNQSRADLTSSIPAISITSVGLEYYLAAIDDFGSESYSGSPDNPHIVVVPNDELPADCNNFVNITICANEFTESTDMSTTTATGSVQIGLAGSPNIMLSFSGALVIDNTTTLVTTLGPGLLSALDIVLGNNSPVNVNLMNQTFSFDGKASNITIIPQNHFTFMLGSISTLGKSIKLGGSSVSIDSALVMPLILDFAKPGSLQSLPISLGDFTLSQVSGQSSGAVTLDFDAALGTDNAAYRLGKFGSSGLSVMLNKLTFDALAPRVGITGTANWNQSAYELGVGVGLSPVTFDSFNFAWRSLSRSSFFTARKIPIGTTGMVIVHNKTALEWNRLPSYSVKGSISGYFSDAAGLIASSGNSLGKHIVTGTLGLEISNQARTWTGSGSLKLLDTFPLASTQLTAGLLGSGQNGFELTGNLNIADVLIGKTLLSAQVGSFYSQFHSRSDLDIFVPRSVFIFGGQQLTGANTELLIRSASGTNDLTAYMQAEAKFGAVNLGVKVDFSDPLDIDFDLIAGIQSSSSLQSKQLNALSGKNSAIQADFEFPINAGQPSAIFVAMTDAGLPDIELVTPLGDVLLAADYLIELGAVGTETQNIAFATNGNNQAFFAINEPDAGNYILRVNNDADLTGLNVSLVLPLPLPEASLSFAQSSVEAGQSFDVELDGSQILQSVEAEFILKAVLTENEIILDVAVFASGINQHTLTLPNSIPPAEYNVLARVRGQGLLTVTPSAPNSITVSNPAAPSKPENLSIVFGNSNAMISWSASTSQNIDGYLIRIVDNVSLVSEAIAVSSDVTEYTAEFLTNGQGYSVSIASVNIDGLSSAYSSAVWGTPTGSFIAGAPDLGFVEGSTSVTSATGNLGEPINLQAIVTNSGQFTAFSARIDCYFDTVSSVNLVESRLIGNLASGENISVSCSVDQSNYAAAGDDLFFTISDVSLPEKNVSNNTVIVANSFRRNTVPIATADVSSVNEDEVIEIDVLANDIDNEGDLLLIESITQPQNGTAVIENGRISYTPSLNYAGSDSFTYRVSDSELISADVVVNIQVNPVNDSPVVDDLVGLTISEGNIAQLNVVATDIEGQSLTYVWTQLSGTAVTLIGSDSANVSFEGFYVASETEILLSVEVSDGELADTKEVTVTILNDNEAPTLSIDVPTSVDEGQTIMLTLNAQDADGQDLMYDWEQTAGPTVSGASLANNILTVTAPSVAQNTVVTFNLSVADSEFTTVESVSVTINNLTINPPPTNNNDSSGGSLGSFWLLLVLPVWLTRRIRWQ